MRAVSRNLIQNGSPFGKVGIAVSTSTEFQTGATACGWILTTSEKHGILIFAGADGLHSGHVMSDVRKMRVATEPVLNALRSDQSVLGAEDQDKGAENRAGTRARQHLNGDVTAHR